MSRQLFGLIKVRKIKTFQSTNQNLQTAEKSGYLTFLSDFIDLFNILKVLIGM